MPKISALCVHDSTRQLLESTGSDLGIQVEARVVAMESALVSVRSAVRQGYRVLVAEDRLWQVLVGPSPLPLVFCGPGAWEVLQAMEVAGGQDVAVMHFGPEQLGLAPLGTQLGCRVVEVICDRSLAAVQSQLNLLQSQGIAWVVGGAAVNSLAERQGFRTSLLLPGPGSVRHALLMAMRLVTSDHSAREAQGTYYRGAATLPSGLLLVEDAQTIHAWGGRAAEVADRLRSLLARSPYFSRKLVDRAAGPGISVEAIDDQTYVVHDVQRYEQVLGRQLRASALGTAAEAGSLVLAVGDLDEMIAQIVVELLRRHGGNRTQVARLLGISRTTLWKRLKELPVSPEMSAR